jgi:multiple sugar transport system substrate-binding protein
MKFKKRLLSLVLMTALVGSLIAGCKASDSSGGDGNTNEGSNAQVTDKAGNTDNTDNTKDTVEIIWYSPNWEAPMNQEIVDAFEKENQGIKVEIVQTEWESYKTNATVAMAGKNAPQLYSVLDTDVIPFAKTGMISSIDELTVAAGMDWSDIHASMSDSITLDGKKYAIPYRLDGDGLYYNVDMLKEVGYDSFPQTYAELAELNDKLIEKGHVPTTYGLGNQGNGVHAFAQVAYTYGAEFFNADKTECLLNSQEAKDALQHIVNDYTNGYASSSALEHNNSDIPDLFGSGRIAYYISGSYDIPTLKENYPELNFATFTLPGINGMGTTAVSGWVVVMAENCEHKEEAAKFLAFLAKAENQAKLTDTFPASYEALEMDEFNTAEYAPFVEQFNNGIPAPVCDSWAEVEPIIFSHLQAALTNTETVDEACEKMTEEANTIINNN